MASVTNIPHLSPHTAHTHAHHTHTSTASTAAKTKTPAAAAQVSEGTLRGRFVAWLNNTATGHALQGIAGLFGAVVSAAIIVSSLATAIFLAVTGLTALSMHHLTLGFIAIALSVIFFDVRAPSKLTQDCWQFAMKQFGELETAIA